MTVSQTASPPVVNDPCVRPVVNLAGVHGLLRATGRRLSDPAFRTEAMEFWSRTYRLDKSDLDLEDAEECWVVAYYDRSELVATVGFDRPDRRGALALAHALPARAHPILRNLSDIVEVSRLCIKESLRGAAFLKRICEDVHQYLVTSRRSVLVLASPPWLRRQYRFLGFRGTGYTCPIPGMPGQTLEVMTSRQKRFGTYGLHVGPLRWNIFLRDITRHLLQIGEIRHNAAQRLICTMMRLFAPFARWLERRVSR